MKDNSTVGKLTSLRHFLTRDIAYLIGGFSVVLSFAHAICKLEFLLKQERTAIWLCVVGISYIIGFGCQELFSLFRIVTTAGSFKPGRLVQGLYWLYMREEWNEEKVQLDVDQYTVCAKINQDASATNLAERERMVALWILCTTIGPCFTLSGILLLLKSVFVDLYFLILAIPALLFGIFFILLSRIKAAENRKYEYCLYKIFEPNNQQTTNKQNLGSGNSKPSGSTAQGKA